jgi:hypothetical protein
METGSQQPHSTRQNTASSLIFSYTLLLSIATQCISNQLSKKLLPHLPTNIDASYFVFRQIWVKQKWIYCTCLFFKNVLKFESNFLLDSVYSVFKKWRQNTSLPHGVVQRNYCYKLQWNNNNLRLRICEEPQHGPHWPKSIVVITAIIVITSLYYNNNKSSFIDLMKTNFCVDLGKVVPKIIMLIK